MTDTPEFKILHDVPIPAHGRTIYPFDKMKVGSSFVVPLNGRRGERVRNGVMIAAKHYGYSSGAKFISRKVEGGIGVWRVS